MKKNKEVIFEESLQLHQQLPIEDVKKTLLFFPLEKEEYIEIRAITPPHKKGGALIFFCKNPSETLETIKKYDEKRQLYFGINPRSQKGGSAKDISRVTTIIVDVDAIKNIEAPHLYQSTEEEKDQARNTAEKVKRWLEEQGWQPFMAMSGNGWQLWMRIDPIDLTDDNRKEIEAHLKAFQKQVIEKFGDTDDANIDNIGDLPRIIKIIGTKSVKKSTEGRPQRVSYWVDDIPEEVPISEGLNNYILRLAPVEERVVEEIKLDAPLYFKNEFGETLEEIREKDEKLDELLNNIQHPDYPSRSEADMAAIGKLAYWRFSESETANIIMKYRNYDKVRKRGIDYLKHPISKIYPPEEKCPKPDVEEKTSGESQIDRLIKLALDNCLFFRNQYNKAFAGINQKNGSLAVYPLRSRIFRIFLSQLMYRNEGKGVGTEIINACINTLEAKAFFEGDKHEIANRVARKDNCILYDICNDNWNIIEITKKGWKIANHENPIFRRYAHQKPHLVNPNSGEKGNFKTFLNHVRIKGGEAILFIVAVASYLIPDIPHPIIVFSGPPGSTKSTTTKMIRQIIDPSSLETMSLPRDKNEAIQMLQHHWVCGFDNISKLWDWQSDLLCRAVTGEGYTKRELYTDDQDVIYRYRRCIILNDINVPSMRSDAMDRSLLITLRDVPNEERKPEVKVWQDFYKDLPTIFHGLLDIIVRAMQIYDDVAKELNAKGLPRLADFCIWGEAIARSMGYKPNKFYHTFLGHTGKKDRTVIEQMMIGNLVLKLVEEYESWDDSPSKTYEKFKELAKDDGINPEKKPFPQAPHALSRKLNEIETNLKRMGILMEVGVHDEKARRRTRIWKEDVDKDDEDSKEEGSEKGVNAVKPSNHGGESIDAIDSLKNKGENKGEKRQKSTNGVKHQKGVNGFICSDLRSDAFDTIHSTLYSQLGFDKNQCKVILGCLDAMLKKQDYEWYIGELSEETGFQPKEIKRILLDLTSNPKNPTPIRRKDERGDCYVLDKMELDQSKDKKDCDCDDNLVDTDPPDPVCEECDYFSIPNDDENHGWCKLKRKQVRKDDPVCSAFRRD